MKKKELKLLTELNMGKKKNIIMKMKNIYICEVLEIFNIKIMI